MTKVAGTRGRSVFSSSQGGENSVTGVGYYVPSTAKHRIFDRYAVVDGTKLLRRPAFRFTGVGRYGFPAHTARLRVSIPGKKSPWAAGSGIMLPKLRFYIPHDGTRVENVRRAIQSAKRLSDKVLLDIGPKPRFVAGQPFIAGVDQLIVGRP